MPLALTNVCFWGQSSHRPIAAYTDLDVRTIVPVLHEALEARPRVHEEWFVIFGFASARRSRSIHCRREAPSRTSCASLAANRAPCRRQTARPTEGGSTLS